jgi:hypothetical protein
VQHPSCAKISIATEVFLALSVLLCAISFARERAFYLCLPAFIRAAFEFAVPLNLPHLSIPTTAHP